jgi:hypothetical protein
MDVIPFLRPFLVLLLMLLPLTEILWKWVPSYRGHIRLFWIALGGVPGCMMLVDGLSDWRIEDQLVLLVGIMTGQILFYYLYSVYARLRRVDP